MIYKVNLNYKIEKIINKRKLFFLIFFYAVHYLSTILDYLIFCFTHIQFQLFVKLITLLINKKKNVIITLIRLKTLLLIYNN